MGLEVTSGVTFLELDPFLDTFSSVILSLRISVCETIEELGSLSVFFTPPPSVPEIDPSSEYFQGSPELSAPLIFVFAATFSTFFGLAAAVGYLELTSPV